MRWKLLIIAPLLAAIAGAGVCIAAALFLRDPSGSRWAYSWLAPASLVVPLAATVYAAVFVYRHTARRRALQAAATVLLTFIITLAALLLGSLLTGRRAPELLPVPLPNAKTS